jgi:hypothetical protein
MMAYVGIHALPLSQLTSLIMKEENINIFLPMDWVIKRLLHCINVHSENTHSGLGVS